MGLLQDGAGLTDQGTVREGLGLGEVDLNRQLVNGLNRLDIAEVDRSVAAHLFVHAVLAGEGRIFSRQGRAVGPEDAGLELPGDAHEVFRDAAVFQRRDLLDQPRNHVAAGIVARQRFQAHGSSMNVLGAAGQIGIHRRGGLPVENGQRAAGAAAHGGRLGSSFTALGRGRARVGRRGRGRTGAGQQRQDEQQAEQGCAP